MKNMFIVKASDIKSTHNQYINNRLVKKGRKYIKLEVICEDKPSIKHMVIVFKDSNQRLYSVIAGKLHTRLPDYTIPNFRLLGKTIHFHPHG